MSLNFYFVLSEFKDNIPVRPIQSTIHASTTKISKFLDKMIRPIFNDKCSATTIIDSVHLLKGLHTYAKKGLLKPSTLFCSFDIRNLYTMLPQEESLDILIEFLKVHGYTRVNKIDLPTIRQLASTVLQENYFVYGQKVYKQTIGGAMGSSFTLTLANIFMSKWEEKFVSQQTVSNEFYGR